MRFFADLFWLKKSNYQSGQAGLIILLLTVVVLTVGISVASRSTTDVKLSRQEEESNRAYNAAEAGVEQALSQNLNFPGEIYSGTTSVDSNINVNYSIQKINILETRLFQGLSAQADVTGVGAGQGITIQWAKEPNCAANPSALLFTIFRRSGGNITARNGAITPCNRGDGYTLVGAVGTNGYLRQATIPLGSGDIFVRIKPVYNDTHIRVSGSGWNLPTQYYKVRSVADNQQGDESRAVEVNRTKPVAPSLFDYVVFSGNTISQ